MAKFITVHEIMGEGSRTGRITPCYMCNNSGEIQVKPSEKPDTWYNIVCSVCSGNRQETECIATETLINLDRVKYIKNIPRNGKIVGQVEFDDSGMYVRPIVCVETLEHIKGLINGTNS